MKKWIILSGFFLFSTLGIPSISFSKSSNLKVEVPVHILMHSNSAWTEEEILNRFKNSQKIFKESCNIDLRLGNFKIIDNLGLQSIHSFISPKSVQQREHLLKLIPKNAKPVLIYTKEAIPEFSSKPSIMAQAYMMGDLDSPGNLEWLQFDQFINAHGIAILSEDYSVKHPYFNRLIKAPNKGDFDVDAHELGHLLLNDAGHNEIDGNIMSWKTFAPQFNSSQCERMRNYKSRERVVNARMSPIWVNTEAPEIALDSHVHYMPNNGKLLQKILVSKTRLTFLISDSYKYYSSNDRFNGFFSDISKRAEMDRAVNEVAVAASNRFVGACGLSLYWDDAIEVLSECLKLEGMKGIKVHTDFSETLIKSGGYAQKFIDIISKVKSHKPFFIWHIDNDSDYEELKSVYRISQTFKELGFIFAHSFYSTGKVNIMSQIIKSDPNYSGNVYLDISTLNTTTGEPAIEYGYVPAWKEFGIENILFGSDLPGEVGLAWGDRAAMAVLNNTELSKDEKRLILLGNGANFIKKYLQF